MRTGFQRVLTNEDLYPIDDDMTSKVLLGRGQEAWNNSNKSRPRALFWSTLWATRSAFTYCLFPRICLIGFRYAQPFLLSRTVNFASSLEEPDSIGWGLTGAFGLVFLGLAIATGSYYHMTYRFVTTVRGTLVSLIYAKTMDLSITALDESVAVTLMASDTGQCLPRQYSAHIYLQATTYPEILETICLAFASIHEIWAVPVELGIALWLLERQLGLAFLAPTAVAIFAVCVLRVNSAEYPRQLVFGLWIKRD